MISEFGDIQQKLKKEPQTINEITPHTVSCGWNSIPRGVGPPNIFKVECKEKGTGGR